MICRATTATRNVVTPRSRQAAESLTRVAFTLDDVDRVEMHCDQANVASAAVPHRLGFTLERIEDKPILAPAELGRSMIWTCRPGQLREPKSPAPARQRSARANTWS